MIIEYSFNFQKIKFEAPDKLLRLTTTIHNIDFEKISKTNVKFTSNGIRKFKNEFYEFKINRTIEKQFSNKEAIKVYADEVLTELARSMFDFFEKSWS